MAYNPTKIGVAIHQDPKQAHVQLVRMFERCGGSRRKVAAQLGVDESTLCRWLQKLARAGLSDPRGRRKRRGRERRERVA